MENLFNTLCSALAEPEAKDAFDVAEGVELMVLIMKEKKLAKTRAIKVLDYACQTDSDEGKRCCEKLVEVLGLKTLFAVFMGKVRAFVSSENVFLPSLFAGRSQEIQKGTHGHPFGTGRRGTRLVHLGIAVHESRLGFGPSNPSARQVCRVRL